MQENRQKSAEKQQKMGLFFESPIRKYGCTKCLALCEPDFVDLPHAQQSMSKLNFAFAYSASLPSEPSTFTILWMYIFFMFSRAGFRY